MPQINTNKINELKKINEKDCHFNSVELTIYSLNDNYAGKTMLRQLTLAQVTGHQC